MKIIKMVSLERAKSQESQIMADKSILGGVRPFHFPFIGTLNSQYSDTFGSSDARFNQFSFLL